MRILRLILAACALVALPAAIITVRGPVRAPAAAGGTVTIDAEATAQSGTALGNRVLTITVGSGSNRMLTVQCGSGDSELSVRTVNSVVSDVDGALTNKDSQDDAGWNHCELWYKLNPTPGTHTITVTFEAGTTCNQGACGAVSFAGVSQSTPFGTVVKSSPTGTAPSATISLSAGDMGISVIATDSSTLSTSTGTLRWKVEAVESDTSHGSSTITGSGSTAMTWTTANEICSILAVPILHD